MDGSRELADAIRDAGTGLVLVVTGAGISVASGLPTFRGKEPGAIWSTDDMMRATRAYFDSDPAGQWQWYLRRFGAIDGARPNAAHRALARLERWQKERGGDFRLVTQNIDTLHEEAGSEELIKVHGSSDRVRCSRPGCENGSPRGSLARSEIDLGPFLDDPSRATVPRCPACDELLRAHVLFFDEYYHEHSDYRFADVQSAAARAEVLIFVGTSFSVGATDLLVQTVAARGKPMFSIDPHADPLPAWMPITELRELAEELLPGVVEHLERV